MQINPTTPRNPFKWHEVARFAVFASTVVLLALVWFTAQPRPGTVGGRLDYPRFIASLGLSYLALVALMTAASPAGRRRGRFLKLATVSFGLFTGWALVEAGCWLLPSKNIMDNPWYLSTTASATTKVPDLPYGRPIHLRWEGMSRGDLATASGDDDPYARKVIFQTDHQGFRNGRDMDHADLVFIGDSYTEAGNISEANTFPQVVGRQLSMIARNLGRAGYSPHPELTVIKKYGLPCRPRAVVWQLCEGNDLDEEMVYQDWIDRGRPDIFSHQEGTTGSRMEHWQRRSPSYALYAHLRIESRWPFTGLFRDTTGQIHPYRFEDTQEFARVASGHPGWPRMMQALQEGRQLLAKEQVALLVVLIPRKLRVMGYAMDKVDYFGKPLLLSRDPANLQQAEWDDPTETTLVAHLEKFCAAQNMAFLDTTVPLRRAAVAGHMCFLPYDTHLAEPGHALVAELIASRLKAMKVANDTSP
jgi:hypothetical protein